MLKVSMPYRAKLHFYETEAETKPEDPVVSMPYRAKLHFY